MGIRIITKERPLKEVELTEHERSGNILIAVNIDITMEYGESHPIGMDPQRVKRWVYYFREGMSR